MSEFACRCLNVRVRSQPATAAPCRAIDHFIPISAAENGISVVHNQLTFRIRSRAKPVSVQADELQRFTSLRCLVCGMTVYRVSQIIPPDLDSPEGPVLPTDDWVEDTMLTSKTGCVEVAEDCLTGPSIKDAERSPAYSPFFRVVIPPTVLQAETPQTPVSPRAFANGDSPSSPSHSPSDDRTRSHRALPFIQPLFPPAPFTPGHPVFLHLSSVASQRSHAIRREADDFLSRIIADKVGEVTREEAQLRHQVEALWATFRAALHDAEAARAPSTSTAPATTSPPARERVDSFMPEQRVASPAPSGSRPRSALSASVSTSSFRYPRTSTSRHASTSSASLPESTDDTLAVLRGSFRRDLNEDKDVATSFKYTLDITAEMEKRLAERTANSKQSPADSGAQSNGDVSLPKTKQAVARSPPLRKAKVEPAEEPAKQTSPGKAKGKRKVTFDVQPIEKEKPATNGHANADDAIVFDLEDETDGIRLEPFAQSSTLPLNEPPSPHVPQRPLHKRSSSGSEAGLPQSLLSLRPASLPRPSSLRFTASPSRTPTVHSPPPPLQTQVEGGRVSPEPLTPREEALSRLVAADVPSHRSAWRKDSKAWEVFNGHDAISELDEAGEDEDEVGPLPLSNGKAISRTRETHWGPPLAASLPIAINPGHVRTASGGLTYQPKTSLSDIYGQIVPVLRDPSSKDAAYVSTTALRKAAYAERDIARSMDPGALDFITNDEEHEESEVGPDAGSRGRQSALKILKARSELPPEGMWRSLAT